ncbi:MAG: NAD-dependent epimerase [Kiritimatiellia bacterium]
MNILVTGAAGFIGFHLAKRLLDEGHAVVGMDNLSAYYDPKLKEARLAILARQSRFSFIRMDLADESGIARLFADHAFDRVLHLAAQAGVRYSIEKPLTYVASNLTGFAHILEGCRQSKTPHLVYASSSSVYGLNSALPFSVHQNVDHPVSLYAATKKANELMAHTYAHLYQLPATGLRFFTVYGPWGRPDMAPFKFTKAILEGKPIDVYNHGNMERDFTYVDDIVEGIVRVMDRIPAGNPVWAGDHPDPASSPAPYRLYNIGNQAPVKLGYFIACIEKATGRKAVKNLLPIQPGDVPATCADVSDLARDVGFNPATPIEVGIQRFVDWYRSYYKI